MEKKHVGIVDGGFAGLNAARSLKREPNVKITLIDRRNHHLFQPLLYQCHYQPPDREQPLPGVAPVAVQQGRFIADRITGDLKQRERGSFRDVVKGQMAMIGRGRAVTEVGRFRTAGFFAWIVWLVVHIYFLIGFKNRRFVVLSWAWSFLTFRRGARLIVDKHWQSYRQSVPPTID